MKPKAGSRNHVSDRRATVARPGRRKLGLRPLGRRVNLAVLRAGSLAAVPLAYAPNVSPNKGGLPGLSAVEKGVGGVMALGLIACVAWFIIGAIRAGMAGRTNNYQQTADGKQQMLWGAIGAFAIGGASAIITFAFKAGGGVH